MADFGGTVWGNGIITMVFLVVYLVIYLKVRSYRIADEKLPLRFGIPLGISLSGVLIGTKGLTETLFPTIHPIGAIVVGAASFIFLYMLTFPDKKKIKKKK